MDKVKFIYRLTLLWVGFRWVRFAAEGKLPASLPPLSKTVRIMLEDWFESTLRYVVSENTPSCNRTPLILLISAFFCKISELLGKNTIFTQSNSMRAVLKFFQLFSSFCKIKSCFL